MKMGHVAPATAENESGSAKQKKKDPPLPKASPGAKNMKTGPDDLVTVENGTRRHQYRKKLVREHKT
jgi:hypothetical protein